MPIKNPTQWRPGNGKGFVVPTGSLPIVANTLLPLVDNTLAHLPIINTPSYVTSNNPTIWTGSGV